MAKYFPKSEQIYQTRRTTRVKGGSKNFKNELFATFLPDLCKIRRQKAFLVNFDHLIIFFNPRGADPLYIGDKVGVKIGPPSYVTKNPERLNLVLSGTVDRPLCF